MSRVVIAVLVVVTLGLCPVANSATPTQYRSQATVICKATKAKIARVTPPSSPRDFSTYFKAALAIARTQYAALRKLRPPQAFRALHATVLAAERKQLDGIQAGIARVEAGSDPTKVFEAMDRQLTPIGNAEAAAWEKLRVRACI